jgi:hypothetical protein
MPRIRTGQQTTVRTWQQTIVERIKNGKVVPIISNEVSNNLVLGGDAPLIEAYAAYINYPLADNHCLPCMAQFFGVTNEAVTDPRVVKEDYINFIKNRLFDIAEAEGIAKNTLAEVEEEFDNVTLAEFTNVLGYPKLNNGQLAPLLVLADLPLPIYLTTGYHNFIEVALRRAGKEPRTEICRWHKGLEGVPSVLAGDYQPSKDEPLVYHLHGYDEYPGSLVLTEDDYMEFLVAITQNVGRESDPIPRRIRQAMADSSLVLLGYNLSSWDFRVLFWGLIKPRPLQQTSVSVQLTPGEVERDYLQKYLDEFEFKVYWGDIHQYTQELRQALFA